MMITDLVVETLDQHVYQGEYEKRINKLKLDFIELQGCIQANKEDVIFRKKQFQLQLEALREWVCEHVEKLDITRCSSLLAVPSQQLGEDEKLIHRVWMGGGLPETTRNAIAQWDLAIQAVKDNAYQSVLWVWNEEQLKDDPYYIATGGDGEYTLGQYTFGGHISHVNSLQALAMAQAREYFGVVNKLHDNGYYATLSDYFRFMIVIEFGGVYMDSDTIPYKPATLFLAKPEIPDYSHYVQDDAGEWQLHRLDWMNLFLDETGMIIAKKNNHSLRELLSKLNSHYLRLPEDIPFKNKEFELFVFEQLYDDWKTHIGCSFISHDELTQTYSALFNQQSEPVLCGIRGMRLSHDIITGIHLPLSDDESQSYDRCITNLTKANWTLNNSLELAQISDVFSLDEVPRMAYPPQLRSDIEHYHYYNVLSADDNLDRVNNLFSDYMIACNQDSIARGQYWYGKESEVKEDSYTCKASGLRARNAVRFVPGKQTSDIEQYEMAKLIFETSYLEYCSAGNVLGLNLIELQKKQNIEPYITLLQGVYDSGSMSSFLGFFIAGSCGQFDAIKAPYYYRDEMKAVDDAYDDFVMTNLREDDYFISTVVIKHSARGQGAFTQVFNKVKSDALAHSCSRILLTVYASSDALAVYLNKGFEIIDTFDYVQDIFFDKVHLLAYTLSDQ